MSDLRDALESILALCNQSRAYTRRTQQIHEVAMRGLGLTANQREARHMTIFDRVGDEPAKKAFLAREARRVEKAERAAEMESA